MTTDDTTGTDAGTTDEPNHHYTVDRVTLDAAEQMARDHSVSGPHDRAGHSVINDWDLKQHVCLDCGLVSISAVAIEETPCERPDGDFAGLVVQNAVNGDPLVVDDGTATVTVHDPPRDFDLGESVLVEGSVLDVHDEGRNAEMDAIMVREGPENPVKKRRDDEVDA